MTAISTISTVDPSPKRQRGDANSNFPATAPTKAQKELRSTINRVIGVTFFGPLLKMGRESSLKTDFGHGGHGEDVFGAQLDALLAERAGTATNYPLSDVLFQRFSHAAQAYARAAERSAGNTERVIQ